MQMWLGWAELGWAELGWAELVFKVANGVDQKSSESGPTCKKTVTSHLYPDVQHCTVSLSHYKRLSCTYILHVIQSSTHLRYCSPLVT